MFDQIETKILSLYGLGNSYTQISDHIEEIYGVGFSKATISAVFLHIQVQLCIRNSLKFVASKDRKQFAKEFQLLYQAFTKEEAQLELAKVYCTLSLL